VVNITLSQLDAFLAIAERLNMSVAAGAVFMSQSALSKSMTRLENCLNVQLFIRGNRGVGLTPEGEYLYDALKGPFSMIQNAINEVKSVSPRPKRRLRLGFPDAYSYNTEYDVIRQAVETFSAKHPEVEITETIYGLEGLKAALYCSEADIIFGQSFILSDLGDAEIMRVGRLGTYLVTHRDHPITLSGGTDYALLDGEAFYQLSIGDPAAPESYVRTAGVRLGFSPKEVKLVPNVPSLILMIAAGRGVSVSGLIDIVSPGIPIRVFPLPEDIDLFEYSIVAVWGAKGNENDKRRFIDILRGVRDAAAR
jgi:DNA-binding transcriptional LysR family regulator